MRGTMRILAAAALVATPLVGEAQGRYEGPLPAQVEWDLLNVTDTKATFEIRFRNVAAFDPGGFWTLDRLVVWWEYAGCYSSGFGCEINIPSAPDVRGNVKLDAMPEANIEGPARIERWAQFEGNFPAVVGPGTNRGALISDLGLLGCGVPVVPGPESGRYNGITCAEAGFDGWLVFNWDFGIDPSFVGAPPTAFDLRVDPRATFYTQFATVPVTVPEPSSFGLLAVSGVAGALRRRRPSAGRIS